MRRQAAMCVLAHATRAPAHQATLRLAERLSCSDFLRVLGARRKPLALTKLAMSRLSVRLSPLVFVCLWWYGMPCARVAGKSEVC